MLPGQLHHIAKFAATHVVPRPVDVWLPPAYAREPDRHFPVIYLHDGQNLFEAARSYSGVAWDVHITLARMAAAKEAAPAILVGVWNSVHRIPEYMPNRPLAGFRHQRHRLRFEKRFGDLPLSDAYLSFLVDELKPAIDAQYRTLPGAAHTFTMGSSMGGLISLYALCEYPNVFSGAACLSPSWPVIGHPLIAYLRKAMPPPEGRRVYLDSGIEARQPYYRRLEEQVANTFKRAGYRDDIHLVVARFPKDPHSEAAWQQRVHRPLAFLLQHSHAARQAS